MIKLYINTTFALYEYIMSICLLVMEGTFFTNLYQFVKIQLYGSTVYRENAYKNKNFNICTIIIVKLYIFQSIFEKMTND